MTYTSIRIKKEYVEEIAKECPKKMQISEDTLNELHYLKNRGETYEDVVKMLLLNYRESNNK